MGGVAPLIDLGLHDRLALYSSRWRRRGALRRRRCRRPRRCGCDSLIALYAAGGIAAVAYATQRAIIEQEAPPAEITRPNIFVRRRLQDADLSRARHSRRLRRELDHARHL